jgi:hypothetical protein
MTEHPLHPYAYEAQYMDGRRIRWDSLGGPWGEAQLPVRGLRRLLVLGHPDGPIALEPSAPPTGFILRGRGVMTIPGGHTQRFYLGILQGANVTAVQIDELGRITRYDGPFKTW